MPKDDKAATDVLAKELAGIVKRYGLEARFAKLEGAEQPESEEAAKRRMLELLDGVDTLAFLRDLEGFRAHQGGRCTLPSL